MLGEPLHEILCQDLGKSRDVEDVFLGIERGQLAAHLIEVVDQAVRSAAHAGIEGGEQAGRACSDDDDIFCLLHRAYSSVVLVLGLLACAGSAQHAALGWSLGGEAHVFVADDRFARDLYKDLSGSGRLADSLGRRPLLAVDARRGRTAPRPSANRPPPPPPPPGPVPPPRAWRS